MELIELMRAEALWRVQSCEEKLATLDVSAKLERKALNIQKSEASVAVTFTNTAMQRPAFCEQTVFSGRYHDFDRWKSEYETLTSDDKKTFIAFAYVVTMVKNNLLNHRVEELKKSIRQEELFVSKLIVDTLEDLLKEWQKIWNTHGSLKCEVIDL